MSRLVSCRIFKNRLLGRRTLFSQSAEWPKPKYLNENDLREIEQHWKPLVPKLVKDAQEQIKAGGDAKPTYILSRFPHPSGQLHMGHFRILAISVAMAHYHRLMHRKVIHPVVHSVNEEWENMSKSKYNGVDPGDILEKYGSDTTKLLILSDISPRDVRKWNPDDSHERVENMQRKLWKLVYQAINLQNKDFPVPKEEFNENVQKCWEARNYCVRVSI